MSIHLTRETCFRWTAFVLAAAVLGSTGCARETGIVIAVSKGDLATKPDTLRFFVGVDLGDVAIDIPNCGMAARFVNGSESEGDTVAVDGRDLAADPYRLLLRPGDELPIDQDVMVVAVAFSGEQVLGMAALPAPVRFIEGKVLSWELKIEPAAGDIGVLGNGCACALLESGGAVAVTPVADRDCDGDVGAADCNDNSSTVGTSLSEICDNNIDDDCDNIVDETDDADQDGFNNCKDCNDRNNAVYPGARETCDGVDNDCDFKGFLDYTSCYVEDSGECYLGKRSCNDWDPAAGGWVGECTPVGLDPQYRVPRELCNLFGVCEQTNIYYEDNFACASQDIPAVTCTQYLVQDANDGLSLCPGSALLPGLQDGVCTWTLVGGNNHDPYVVRLGGLAGTPADDSGILHDCQASLSIAELTQVPGQEPLQAVFGLWAELDGNLYGMWQVDMKTSIVVDNVCPVQTGLVCDAWPLPVAN